MRKFNLTEALAGAPLVTREGLGVENFKVNPRKGCGPFQYRALIDGNYSETYTEEGRCLTTSEDDDDLFMREGEDLVFNERDIPELKPQQLTAPQFVEAFQALSSQLPENIKVTLTPKFV